MKFGRAFLAGIIGGAIMSFLMSVARLRGVPATFEMMLGTIFGSPPGHASWFLGFVMHLLASGLVALLYAAGFEYFTHRANVTIGLAFSLVHILVAGIFLALLPALHPLIPERIPAPGAFMVHTGGLGAFTFVMFHLMYGAIVGAAYGSVIHGGAGNPGAPGG